MLVLALAAFLATVGIQSPQAKPFSTPEKRIAKSESSLNTENYTSANKKQEAATNVTVVVEQPKSPVSKETDDQDREQAKENLAIQRKLAIFTGLLVLVGALQAVTLVWQAVVFRRQTKATETAANAAKASSDAIVNSERAWLLLGDFTEERHNFKPEGLNLFLIFRNYGKTPAWVVEHRFHFVRVPKKRLESPLEYLDPEIIPFGEPVPPDKPYPRICAPLMLDADLVGKPYEPAELVFFGYIKYQDVFYRATKELRVTYVRMRFERTQSDIILDQKGRWAYDGPPEANWST